MNPKIAQANPDASTNKAFINALFVEAFSRNATKAELDKFVGMSVRDASNLILGSLRSPFAISNVAVPSVVKPALIYPLKAVKITQYFGERPEVYKQFGMKAHDALDLKTRYLTSPLGNMEVMSAHDGVISEAVWGKTGYGNYIKVYQKGFGETLYAHLSKISVAKNQIVKQGQVIGISGNTGFSTAPHLHFSFRPEKHNLKNGYFGRVDPIPYLPKMV